MRKNRAKADTRILLVLLLLSAAIFCGLRPKLFSMRTLQSIGFQFPELGILTLAMVVTMIIGGINLSCVAASNFSAILVISLLRSGVPVPAALAAGMAVCVLIGIGNGMIVAFLRVPDILATLSTQMLLGGLNLVITRGGVISYKSESLSFIGMGSICGIPIPLLVFAAAVLLAWIFLTRTRAGWEMYLYGANPVVSAYNGTSRVKLTIRTHAVSGLFTGAASVVMTARFSSASASYAASYLLQTVLIAVLAGVNPDGGSGKAGNLVLAVLLVQILATGFNALRLDSHLSSAILGIILLISIGINMILERDSTS